MGQLGEAEVEAKEDYLGYACVDAAFEGSQVRGVKCGSESTYVVCDEAVFACGWNEHGNLGAGEKTVPRWTHLGVRGRVKSKGAFSVLVT